MPLQEDYRVALETFHGPLDLLLFLIRRAEVDVTDIPLAEITDQYLAFLGQVDEVDVELAGEFLVMAATLIELKSRTIAPPEERAGGDRETSGGVTPGDPRFELVQQLLAYQRYRVAADELDARRRLFEQRFPRRPGRGTAGPVETDESDETELELEELELDDVHVMDLADAYERVISAIDFSCLGDHVIEMDDTPISLHQDDLMDRLRRTAERRLRLQDAFAGRSPSHRVGLFLATLELARTRAITVLQDDVDSAIELVLLDPLSAAEDPPGSSSLPPDGSAPE